MRAAKGSMEEREQRALIGVLLVVIGLTGLDIVFDFYFGSTWRHIGIEVAVILAAALGIAYLWWRMVGGLRHRIAQSEAAGARWRADAERWRGEAAQFLAGLSVAIDRQFDAWALTESEKEVALLLLKGLSLKEIADVRTVAEKTVRKQSLAVYRKAGLTGRAELAAYFLEDLLLPSRRPPESPTPATPAP